MSVATVRRTIYDDAQEAELEKWPGVGWRRDVRAKHYELVLSFGDRQRFVVYPCSPGDGIRGVQNHLRDVRKVLRELGAIKVVEAKSTAPRRERNRAKPQPERLVITDRCTGGPKRDPWEALRAISLQQPTPDIQEHSPTLDAAPPPRPWWRRVYNWFSERFS